MGDGVGESEPHQGQSHCKSFNFSASIWFWEEPHAASTVRAHLKATASVVQRSLAATNTLRKGRRAVDTSKFPPTVQMESARYWRRLTANSLMA